MVDRIILQFSSSTAWTSGLIRIACRSNFSHVDIRMPRPDGTYDAECPLLGASDQGPDSPYIEGNPQGVAIRPYDYQPFHIRRDMVITTRLADRIIDIARGQLGKNFDKSMLSKAFGEPDFSRNWQLDDHWFCSELCVWCFETAGYWAPRKLLWSKDRVSPNDLVNFFMFDDAFVNRDSFMEQLHNIKLGTAEI